MIKKLSLQRGPSLAKQDSSIWICSQTKLDIAYQYIRSVFMHDKNIAVSSSSVIFSKNVELVRRCFFFVAEIVLVLLKGISVTVPDDFSIS